MTQRQPKRGNEMETNRADATHPAEPGPACKRNCKMQREERWYVNRERERGEKREPQNRAEKEETSGERRGERRWKKIRNERKMNIVRRSTTGPPPTGLREPQMSERGVRENRWTGKEPDSNDVTQMRAEPGKRVFIQSAKKERVQKERTKGG